MTEKFVATGKWNVPTGPLTVYLEWHNASDCGGEMLPGRLFPPWIEVEGRTYQFDGMEPTRARYTRK